MVPKLPRPVPTHGNCLKIEKLSCQTVLVDSQETAGIGGAEPATRDHTDPRQTPAASEPTRSAVRPIACQREPAAPGSPTASRPTTNGRQNQGPAIIPTSAALATSMITKSTTRPPCPVWLIREVRP